MNYSIICSDSGTMYISKTTDGDQYSDIFANCLYSPNSAISTSYNAWTTTLSRWHFSYNMQTANKTIYKYYDSVSYKRGVTKASIILMQETE